jgi:hypothetical protein
MISDIFAKESIISYFRSDIIAGPEGFGKNLQNLDSVQLGSGFGGMGDRFDLIFPPMQPYLKACLFPSVI